MAALPLSSWTRWSRLSGLYSLFNRSETVRLRGCGTLRCGLGHSGTLRCGQVHLGIIRYAPERSDMKPDSRLCKPRGFFSYCPLVALTGVVGRCGVVTIQRSSSATTATNVSTTLRAASTLYCFNGIQGTCMPRRPRRAGQTASTHARVRTWIPQGKASDGIDIYQQATDAGM